MLLDYIAPNTRVTFKNYICVVLDDIVLCLCCSSLRFARRNSQHKELVIIARFLGSRVVLGLSIVCQIMHSNINMETILRNINEKFVCSFGLCPNVMYSLFHYVKNSLWQL